MKFLSKLASVILKGVQIASGFMPLVAPALPTSTQPIVSTINNDLPAIASIITAVEVMGQALQIKGPDKLKAAAPQVAQIVLQSSLLINHKIADANLFNQGCASIASGVADVLNSLSSDGVKTIDKTA